MANEFEDRLNKVNNPSQKSTSYSKEYQTAHAILKDTAIRHHQIIKGI